MAGLSEDKCLKIVNSMIMEKGEVCTANKLAEKLKISVSKCNDLLIKYISDDMSKLIVLFTAEMQIDNCLKTLVIPSYSEELDGVLNHPGLMGLSVVAVERKKDDFMLNNYSVYDSAIEVQSNAAAIETILEEANEQKLKPKSAKKSPSKKSPAKNDTVKSVGKNLFGQNGNGKGNGCEVKKKENGKEVTTTNICANSKKNMLKDEDIVQENLEEEFFYGGKPKEKEGKKTAETVDTMDVDSSSMNDSNKINDLKRKRRNQDKSPKKEDFRAQQEAIISHVQDTQEDHASKLENEQVNANGKKMVKKTRRKEITKQYLDADGYTNTKVEYIDEEYFEEVDVKNKSKTATQQVKEGVNTKKGAKNAEPDKKQGSLLNFFKK